MDDFCSEWRVATDDYVQVPSSPNGRVLSDDEIAFVQEQVKKRAAHKRKKDYESADDIRDSLRESFGVSIDDRTKEWKVTETAVDNTNTRRDDGSIEDDLDASLADLLDIGVGEDPFTTDVADTGIISEQMNETDQLRTTEPNGAMSAENLTKLTVPVLKGMLKERGLKVSGNKAELVDRLLA